MVKSLCVLVDSNFAQAAEFHNPSTQYVNITAAISQLIYH